jgi:hypothetical protein
MPPSRPRRAWAAAALLALAATAAPAQAQSVPPAPAFVALTRARLAADFRADRAALDTLLAEDLAYGRSSGVVHDKRQVLALVGAGGPYQLDRSDPDSLVARVEGQVGVVRGLLTVKLTAQPAPYTLRFLDVWARRGDRWQLVAFQATRLPDPPPAGR